MAQNWGRAASPTAHAAERQFLDGVSRVLRGSARGRGGWMVVAMHLSHVGSGGPRPHHRRVAAAVLDDAAARADGQLFALANGDIAMLFRPADGGVAVSDLLARLFQAAVPNLDAVRSIWPLPDAAAEVLAYARLRMSEDERAAPPPERAGAPGVVAALEQLAQTTPMGNLMHRQTAVLLLPGPGGRMSPLFREIACSTAVLEAQIAAIGQAQADPFLFRHLATRLDERLLATLHDDVPAGGPLSVGLAKATLHLNLSVAGILSEGFQAFAAACCPQVSGRPRLAAEISLIEVFADPAAFLLARERLRLAGIGLVLDGLTADLLSLCDVTALKPELVKLSWNARLSDQAEALQSAVARLGAERIVVNQLDSEAGLAWGLRMGIRRFQGFLIDRILASQRVAACRTAPGCTARQCGERASASGPAGRSGCVNTALLDAAAPAIVSLPAHAAAVATRTAPTPTPVPASVPAFLPATVH